MRAVRAGDAGAIADIYNWYIENSISTFEQEAVTEADMAERIAVVTSTNPWLVLEADGRLLGYAYAAPWKARAAYRLSRECSVYLHHQHAGKGWGRLLMEALIQQTKGRGVHVLIAGISLPNDASVGLHEALGFQKVGEFIEVGNKFDRLINVGYWQLFL